VAPLLRKILKLAANLVSIKSAGAPLKAVKVAAKQAAYLRVALRLLEI